MISLDVVVVDLQCAVRSVSREPYYVILVVIDFHTALADRMIVRAHVVNGEHIALDLRNE